MPLVHSSHSCTICRRPRSPRRASPRPGQAHLPIAAPQAATAATAPPLPALAVCRTQPTRSQIPAPPLIPLLPRARGKRERAGQPQRLGGTPDPSEGAAAPLQLLAGKEGSGGAGGQPGKLGAGEPGGVEREDTLRGERGALDRGGWAGPAGARDSAGKRETLQATGTREEGVGARTLDLGLERRKAAPRAGKAGAPGCWGRGAACQEGRN